MLDVFCESSTLIKNLKLLFMSNYQNSIEGIQPDPRAAKVALDDILNEEQNSIRPQKRCYYKENLTLLRDDDDFIPGEANAGELFVRSVIND